MATLNERQAALFTDRTRIVVRTEGGGASRGVPGRARVVELHAQEAV